MNEETFKKLYIDYHGLTYLQDIIKKEHTFTRMAALYEFLGFSFATDTEEGGEKEDVSYPLATVIEVCTDYDNMFVTLNGEEFFLVLLNEEAEEKARDLLNMHLEEFLNLPEALKPYFDKDRWFSDQLKEGRGPIISTYDREEYRVTVSIKGEKYTYFIYQV